MKKQSIFLVAAFIIIGTVSLPAYAKGFAGNDKKFFKEAANGGMMEVELGRTAEQKAQSPDVKAFGTRMSTEHGKANDELKTLAGQKKESMPPKIEAKMKADIEKLTKLSGADFDKQYMTAMVKDHTKDVADFRKASEKLKDPDLKAWVDKTLPVLEDHLKQAKEIAQKLGVDVNAAEAEGNKESK